MQSNFVRYQLFTPRWLKITFTQTVYYVVKLIKVQHTTSNRPLDSATE